MVKVQIEKPCINAILYSSNVDSQETSNTGIKIAFNNFNQLYS